MAVQKTSVGLVHYAERLEGAVLTNTFDAIELGTGDTAVSKADDRSTMANKIAGTLIQQSAAPAINNADVANSGRGPAVLTYKFTIPAGVAAFTATNLHLTNYQGGAPSATEPVGVVANGLAIVKTAGVALDVYLNVSVGGA